MSFNFSKIKIVGFAGLARSGKDTASDALWDWLKFKFADGVYDGFYQINPWVKLDFEVTTADGNYILREGSFHRLQDLVAFIGWEEAKKHEDVRVGLQRYGTEAGRDIHGENCWVDALKKRIVTESSTEDESEFRVTDVRFPNEYEAIKSMGGIVIGITRPGVVAPNSHVSEKYFDVIHDRLIVNDGSILELHQKVRLVVEEHYGCRLQTQLSCASV